MRPDVPSLLRGVAAALETDALDAVTDLHARRQVASAIGILRRVASLVPHLHALLLADVDDALATLTGVADRLDADARERLRGAADLLAALEPRTATLDDLDACHQRVLALVDDVVSCADPSDALLDAALRGLATRAVSRERAVGASIAGR